MLCEACERDDHDNCGMQTWCECDCEGYQEGCCIPDQIEGLSSLCGAQPTAEHIAEWKQGRTSVKKLMKFVAVTRTGNWFDMHGTPYDAIDLCKRHPELLEVQRWCFTEQEDGSHDAPAKETYWVKPVT